MVAHLNFSNVQREINSSDLEIKADHRHASDRGERSFVSEIADANAEDGHTVDSRAHLRSSVVSVELLEWKDVVVDVRTVGGDNLVFDRDIGTNKRNIEAVHDLDLGKDSLEAAEVENKVNSVDIIGVVATVPDLDGVSKPGADLNKFVVNSGGASASVHVIGTVDVSFEVTTFKIEVALEGRGRKLDLVRVDELDIRHGGVGPDHDLKAGLSVDGLGDGDLVNVVGDVDVGARRVNGSVVDFTAKVDDRVNSKLGLVEALDGVSDLAGVTSSDNLARSEILEFAVEHEKAISAAISSINADLRDVAKEVLVDNDLLLGRLEVVVVSSDEGIGLDLNTDGPVFSAGFLAQVRLHVVLLASDEGNPEGECEADVRVFFGKCRVVISIFIVEVAEGSGPASAKNSAFVGGVHVVEGDNGIDGDSGIDGGSWIDGGRGIGGFLNREPQAAVVVARLVELVEAIDRGFIESLNHAESVHCVVVLGNLSLGEQDTLAC